MAHSLHGLIVSTGREFAVMRLTRSAMTQFAAAVVLLAAASAASAQSSMKMVLDWNFEEAPYFIESEYGTGPCRTSVLQ